MIEEMRITWITILYNNIIILDDPDNVDKDFIRITWITNWDYPAHLGITYFCCIIVAKLSLGKASCLSSPFFCQFLSLSRSIQLQFLSLSSHKSFFSEHHNFFFNFFRTPLHHFCYLNDPQCCCLYMCVCVYVKLLDDLYWIMCFNR